MKDLVVLVADNQAKAAVGTLLSKRRPALGICDIQFDILVHPKRDPGCFQTSQDLLRSQIGRYHHCMVVFDHEGCGLDHRLSPGEVADDVQMRLSANGWSDWNSCVVVIAPELEAWVWSGSIHVAKIVAGFDTVDQLVTLLRDAGFLPPSGSKPARPKEAMEYALRTAGKPHSASVFGALAESVSLTGCVDPAFSKFGTHLRSWFPT